MPPRFVFSAALLFWSNAAFLCPAEPLPATTTDDVSSVRFVAYNLRNYTRRDRIIEGEIVPGVPKPEVEKVRIVAFLSELKADVIGVCEIGDLADVEDLRGRLEVAGLSLPHVEWVHAADEERRLALLSRFPIVERNSQLDLGYTIGEIDLPLMRGILDVTLQINGGYRLRCLGAHLKSKRETTIADEALMRRNEAHLVRQHVEAILKRSPETNLLLYGDFNATRNEPSIRVIQGTPGSPLYLTALRLADSRGETWTHYWDDAGIYSRIDFIFTSKGLNREVDPARSSLYDHAAWYEASDHRPMVTVIEPIEAD